MSTFEEIRAAIVREDGVKLSRLISVLNGNPEHWASIAYSTNAAMADTDIRRRFSQPLWGDIAYTYWQYAVGLMKNHSLVEAYILQNEMLQTLNRIAERSDNWILPVLSTVAGELRKVAFLAGETKLEGELKEKHDKKIEEITRTINRSFNICLNDRNQTLASSKRWGTYFFAGELFKTYFKLNKQPLAKSVLKVISAMVKELPALNKFPKSHQVTYLYYWGVILFIDGDYTEASKKLTQALDLCKTSSHKNMERILLYLIPVNLIENRKKPSRQLLQAFPRLQVLYGDLLKGLTTADLKSYDRALVARRHIFVKKFIYLAMEVLRGWVVLNLIYVTYCLSGKPSRLSIDSLFTSFNLGGFFDDDYDENDNNEAPLNELEAIVGTWIARGHIKGYISHERRTVVLSNKDPFPGRAG
jgi:COP9 signalosome complex subunit 12